MVVHPLADTVWLYYFENRVDAVAEKAQSIFQRPLSDEEYVKLLDARTGEVVRISPDRFQQSLGVFIPTIYIKLFRIITGQSEEATVEYSLSNNGNGAELTLLDFQIPQVVQGMGLGTRMFAAQVAAAHTFGFNRIVAYALRREDQNGYYTWPRLGFDKHFTAKEQARLPAKFAHLTCLSDLMQQPEGRQCWREHGFGLEVIFDTSAQSRSMEILQAALNDLDRKGKFWEVGPEMPLRIERGANLRPRRDWLKRIWEYRQREPEPKEE